MAFQSDSSKVPDRLSSRDIDFLDHILQDLFGMGLKLQYCLAVLDDTPAEARDGIEDVVTTLGEMAEPIRMRIHNLQ